MSSTERAPEPTMEEILASIRRIISDDEAGSAQPTASASHQDEESLEVAEGEADDEIISDIARVLSARAPAAEEEEDILDLTAELGGLEPVEESLPEEVAVAAEAPSPLPIVQAAPAAPEQPEAVPQPQVEVPEPVAAPPLSASEEAASALERAIAALRAGHVPTSVAEFTAQPEPELQPQPELQLQPEPQPEPEPEMETDLVLTEFEAELIVEEPVVVEAVIVSEAAESPTWESVPAPWAGSPEPLVEPERPTARGNGSSAHGAAAASTLEAAQKTLEDSVKDMLRPMLRQWLDENMPRVLTAALKDELTDDAARGQGD